MDITYLGHASFLLKGDTGSVVTDPYSKDMLGKALPKVEANLITVSHDHGDHNAVDAVNTPSDDTPLVLTMPGEYEKHKIRVQGFQTYHDKNKGEERGKNTIYKITIDDVDILHCGDLGHMLKASTIDQIGNVDVILVPVGGHFTINADEANDIVSKLEPSIVIPMHYKNDAFNKEIMDKLAPVDDFLQKIGTEAEKPGKKYKVKQGDLSDEDMKVVVLDMS